MAITAPIARKASGDSAATTVVIAPTSTATIAAQASGDEYQCLPAVARNFALVPRAMTCRADSTGNYRNSSRVRWKDIHACSGSRGPTLHIQTVISIRRRWPGSCGPTSACRSLRYCERAMATNWSFPGMIFSGHCSSPVFLYCLREVLPSHGLPRSSYRISDS